MLSKLDLDNFWNDIFVDIKETISNNIENKITSFLYDNIQNISYNVRNIIWHNVRGKVVNEIYFIILDKLRNFMVDYFLERRIK